jgi:hypothetical protein
MSESALLTSELSPPGRTLTSAAILSVATELPPDRLTNAELAAQLGVTRTGS